MPRTLTEIDVLIASPGDVVEEREVAKQVAEELNLHYRDDRGVILRPRLWESDSAPVLGGRPQQILNDQFADSCDIVVGIFWSRLGTPTGEADSGTVEEIRRAIDRYSTDARSTRVAVFFSAQPVSPYKVDPEQLAAVQDFERELKGRGVTARYDTIDVFENRLRAALLNAVKEWGSKWGPAPDGNLVVPVPRMAEVVRDEDGGGSEPGVLDEDHEPGILDLAADFHEQLDSATRCAERLGEQLTELCEALERGTTEIQNLDQDSPGAHSRARRAVNSIASLVESFSVTASAEIENTRRHFSQGMEAFRVGVQLSAESGDYTSEDAALSAEAMRSLRDVMSLLALNAQQMSEEAQGFPRLTAKMNRARRKLLDTLAGLLRMSTEQLSIIDAMEEQITQLIEES